MISTSPICRSAWISASSRRIWAWTVTSSAVVGSSAMSTSRIQRQGRGDHHALAHAAGELVRVVPDPVGGPRHLDQVEQLDRPAARVAAADAAPHPQHLGELVAHRVHRVEGGESVLEHHRHVFAGVGAALLGRQRQHVGAAEPDRAPRHPRRRAEQPHHGERADRLAAAGLADDRQRAPGRHGVGQAVDGVEHAVARAELDGEVVDLEQRRRGLVAASSSLTAASGRGRRAARRRARRATARWPSGSRAGTAAGRRSHR